MKQINLLEELTKTQNLEHLTFSISIRGDSYKLNNVIISKNDTPLTKKALRGGVYISDKFVYQIKGTVFNSSLAKSLSDFMLGPNFKFKELEISIDDRFSKWNTVSIIVNLVNSAQKQTRTELTMNIIKLYQK